MTETKPMKAGKPINLALLESLIRNGIPLAEVGEWFGLSGFTFVQMIRARPSLQAAVERGQEDARGQA
jgi:hypothetical protein